MVEDAVKRMVQCRVSSMLNEHGLRATHRMLGGEVSQGSLTRVAAGLDARACTWRVLASAFGLVGTLPSAKAISSLPNVAA